MAKLGKHIFSVGERVCFSVFSERTNELMWHIGEIVSFSPVRKPGDVPRVHIVPYEIPDRGKECQWEDWDVVSLLYFKVPQELIILDRLSSRTKWSPKKLTAHLEVDVRDICVARHDTFLGVFVSKKESWKKHFSTQHD